MGRWPPKPLVTVIGILVGLEIPLLMRIVREQFDFRDTVAHVLSFRRQLQ